jgi:hypothetical protein
MSDPVQRMAMIRGLTTWATVSESLRYAAARLTAPQAPLRYLMRAPKAPPKANGSPRQRRHPQRK